MVTAALEPLPSEEDGTRRMPGPLLERLSDGFMHVGHDWRITYANPSARHGRNRSDFEGKSLWDLFPEAKGTEFEARYRQAMEGRARLSFESYYAPTRSWMENTLIPVEDGLWLYYRDVTDRRRLEALLSTRTRQQAAVEHIGREALSDRSVDQLLALVVGEVAQTLGTEFASVLEFQPGMEWATLRAGHGWQSTGEPLLLALAEVPYAGFAVHSGAPVVVEDFSREARFERGARLQRQGIQSCVSVVIQGSQQPFGVLSVQARRPRRFGPDDVNFVQAVAHMLAAAIERRRIEAELRRHRDHLEDLVAERTRRLAESNQEMEAFNYSVSHDLRTPLRAIAGLSGLLAQRHGPTLTPAAQRLVEQVQAEAVRMGVLIEELLNLARFHRMDLARESVDLSAMATEVLAALAAAQPARSVEWSVEPGLRVHGDPRLLRVVLENLLGNSWKFIGRTQGPRIEVFGTAASKGTTVCVRDNGAGFDMAYAQKLFQPFQRLHSPAEFEGTGIGLATVARIVHRHGGKVWADGRVGAGASFYFALPD